MAATGINKDANHFDVASSPFQVYWCIDVAAQYLLDIKEKKKTQKELMKHFECTDVLVE